MESGEKTAILHILVVGFHHKLGCQVEFSYPPLIPGSTGKQECPSGWKYLPTLALPDGSHRFTKDTVFFNLPSLLEPAESVYGVSCYRQIPVEKLKTRTADVTRSTVQKSVCILIIYPIYGYVEVKLSLIADAFFDQGDFSNTDLLVNAYQQLNACLADDEARRPLRHFHVGLSLRSVVLQWRHKTLILLKLFLLQRRVVCFGSPVRGMCALILSVASLIPRLLEKGFQEVACVRTSRPLSPMPDFTDSLQREAAAMQQQELGEEQLAAKVEVSAPVEPRNAQLEGEISSVSADGASGDASPKLNRSVSAGEGVVDADRYDSERRGSLSREASVDTVTSTLSALAAVNPDEYRAPISIFASGNLCLPYLSLPYMDLLSDPSVLSYVIGTSNVLFQQKRQLADVLVDIENSNMDVHDQDLRRQLTLSTEDLRFMDFLLRHVQTPKEDAEGSEYWIREQFQGYLLALLRTTVASDATSKDNDHFNAYFMQAFTRTQCFQEWYDVRPEPEFFDALPVGHPFAGTLSVADMKLKIVQTMQNSESGRKINQAVNNTSRAVGGAISQAKGAVTNWWSSITTAPVLQTEHSVGNTDSANARPQSQEISVAFQNSKNVDKIAEAVSIHMEEAALQSGLSDRSSSDSSGKLIDSAEEIDEDNFDSAKREKALASRPPPVGPCAPKQPLGVVEIGKEAEVLDKSTAEAAHAPNVAANLELEQHSNGDVFIV